MKKTEFIYRDILYNAIEEKEPKFTQLELSKKLNLSLSVINSAVKKLEQIGAVKIMQRGFRVIDIKKIIYLWASLRNLQKDIIFKARVEIPVREIERTMPNLIFTAYTAYKLKFNDYPADYSEIYAYADEEELDTLRKRFVNIKIDSKNPNLFVLKRDSLMSLYKTIPISQIFVDLWNLKEWYARDFLKSLERRITT